MNRSLQEIYLLLEATTWTTELIMEGMLAIVVIYLDEAAMSADLAVAGTTLEQTLISWCVSKVQPKSNNKENNPSFELADNNKVKESIVE